MNSIQLDGRLTIDRPQDHPPTSPIPHQRSSTRPYITPVITELPRAAVGDYNNAGPDVYWPVNPAPPVQSGQCRVIAGGV